MVFGADPMQPSLSTPTEGAGMSPSLQHPVMLIHPPVVFLGYAIWAVPFALALSALLTGQINRHWFEQARRWTLCAWTILGLGILLGAKWAYEELGWGGYWSWDPVENGSLIPWLTGTALIHCGLAWHYRGSTEKNNSGAFHNHLCALQFCRISNSQRNLRQPARIQPIAHRLVVLGIDGIAGGFCGRARSICDDGRSSPIIGFPASARAKLAW